MREIKFRAWNLDYKCMNDYFYIGASGTTYDGADRIYDTPNIEIEENPNLIVMQYTGLKDTNGTDIYEGDIVKFKSRMDSAIGTVEYSSAETRFVFNIGTGGVNDYRDVGHGWYGTEIIGNIHENPELMDK